MHVIDFSDSQYLLFCMVKHADDLTPDIRCHLI